MADMSWVKCVAFDECTRPSGCGPSDRRWLPVSSELQGSPTATGPLQATSPTAQTVTMRPYGIESARTLRSHGAADGCTVLMKEVPAPRGRTCKATASAKHSAL